jgi:hypothetical protein
MKFTCTEKFGKYDLNLLILEPLVQYLNEDAGRYKYVITEEAKEQIRQMYEMHGGMSSN